VGECGVFAGVQFQPMREFVNRSERGERSFPKCGDWVKLQNGCHRLSFPIHPASLYDERFY
jgi:hypothetical protein